MPSEKELNSKLKDAMNKYIRENRRQQNGAIANVHDARKKAIDILTEYAEKDDKINKKKVKKILSELDAIETDINEKLEKSIDDTIDRTTDKAIKWSLVAFGSLIASEAISTKKLKKSIKEDVLQRDALRSITLKYRINRISGNTIDGVREVVRSGVIGGSSINAINRDIKKSVKKNEWQIRRLVMSEGYNAYRKSNVEIAKRADRIKAIKIIDRRGQHPYHHQHECYRLAEQDKYGWGKGVYRLEDKFIYYPHPQCTAYYEYILKDEEGGT